MKGAYQLAVGSWGMRPKDFWRLSPAEFWWVVEAKMPPKMFGKMTEAEAEELYQAAYGSGDA